MSEVQGSWMQFLISSIRREVEDTPPMEGACQQPMEPGTWRCLACSRPFNQITILPCQHKFCEKCLSLWVGIYIDLYQGQRGQFPCQVCWKVVTVPDQGLHVFTHDYQVQKLQDSLSEMSMDTSVPPPQHVQVDCPAMELSLPTPGVSTIQLNPGYCYQGFKNQACSMPHHLM